MLCYVMEFIIIFIFNKNDENFMEVSYIWGLNEEIKRKEKLIFGDAKL